MGRQPREEGKGHGDDEWQPPARSADAAFRGAAAQVNTHCSQGLSSHCSPHQRYDPSLMIPRSPQLCAQLGGFLDIIFLLKHMQQKHNYTM